jgi:hypothetical protein
MKQGTQVVYVPYHVDRAEEDYLNHPDCERGFVVEDLGDRCRCRFWHRTLPRLRTLANSETALRAQLVECASRPQQDVLDALQQISEEDARGAFR